VEGNGVVSFGLSHCGYDLRLGRKVLIFKNSFGEIVNPKKFKSDPEYHKRLFDVADNIPDGEPVLIPPNGYILGCTVERIKMPRWLQGRVMGKSTLARCGVLVNCTKLEPNWEGYLTLEIANVSPCPVMVFVGEGIGQLEFETLTSHPETDYKTKQGKYDSQVAEPVPARVKE
jgi:dCTP deaminase